VKALIVIDVQNGVYAYEDTEVCAGQALIATINRLIAAARAAGCPVVFVQHEDEWLLAGSHEWELKKELDARADTDIFVGKRHGSAFHATPLEETLRRMGIDEVVLCGLQTEMCVDSTLRHAVALNFAVSLADDAHSTFDTATLTAPQIIEHHNRTLANYARVVPADAISFAADAPNSMEQQPS
jgi:nicotinamidase-related amidase